MYLSFWVQRYSKIPELLLHGIRGKFHIFRFLLFYDLNALGFWPRLFCTKREKWEGDEKSNI